MNRELLRLLGYSALVVLVVLLIAVNVLQSVEGLVIVAVVSGRSMYPVLRTGDIVFVIPKQVCGTVSVGDVIVYRDRANELIIHRVVAVEKCGDEYYFRVKGDNNPMEDYYKYSTCPLNKDVRGIPWDRVVGKVFSVGGTLVKIPYIGLIKVVGLPQLIRAP